ncbi:MAG: head GIN domain-containing protein [Flavobacteriaceae bacterium]
MKITYYISCFLLLTGHLSLAQKITSIDVDHFEKVIISPYIQVDLVEGNEESVAIESAVDEDKLNIEVSGRTLWVYLDDAKHVPGQEKVKKGNYTMKKDIYNHTMAHVTITYKTLKTLSVRGEETIRLKSAIEQDNFTLRIYGESQVYLPSVALEELKVTIYGESYLEGGGGHVDYQKLTTYGESKVNTLAIENDRTKIIAYGESDIRVRVSNRLRVTCYGETHVTYEGSPTVDRGVVIGESTIRKIG